MRDAIVAGLGRGLLSTAIPDIADRRLCPASAEAIAGPTSAVKAGAAIPIGWPRILRPLPFDPFG